MKVILLFALVAIVFSWVEAYPEETTGQEKPCNTICALNYDPVCGKDTSVKGGRPRTFPNECALRAYNCKNYAHMEVIYKGECENSGRVRLSNSVEAYPNEMTRQRRPCNINCALIYDPVCGKDPSVMGSRPRTFANECALHAYNCRNYAYMEVIYRGECENNGRVRLSNSVEAYPEETTGQRKPCNTICGFNYDPVCGKDSSVMGSTPRTFPNECALRAYNCEHYAHMEIIHRGECKNSGGVRLS